ncbi:hypothetical protein MSG28_006538 [Choristoneura fumiferana]|uniref:Uncharacterized protein n=1 Tax=Choristoneura fumiferana TaxID=7141 RepID=A0ACC0JFA7_CHOFU|nr:hypothetical protein MSG28_006538 [Choristoneura fumiferana]
MSAERSPLLVIGLPQGSHSDQSCAFRIQRDPAILTSLIVGAPKASNPSGSMASGVVFNCALDNLHARNVTCQPLKLENDGRFSSSRDFFRNDMWFGATIAEFPEKKLLICAPRWAKPYRDRHLLANGACYLQTKKRGLPIYPLGDMKHQAYMTNGVRKEYGAYGTHLNFYAYAQAGLSMKVTQNNTIIIGAPGLLQWSGGIVEYRFGTDVNSIYLNKRPIVNPYFTDDIGPDDYLGYSVESGIFEDGGSTLYVSGAPRARVGFGQVLVFEPPRSELDSLKIRAKLEGPQLGSYFGASLCCMDINGDGRTDVLVGAPNYIGKGEEVYDQGAVFVYLNKEEATGFILDYAGRVTGSEAVGARFGSTIADLGDDDGDGFRDIAVSAPWENDGEGAVYIYRGDKHGLRSQYVQRIVARGARGLGMSIANGHDVDGNKCNDLAIGAHATGTAYIYRCIPTIHVHANIKIPEAVDLPQNATNFTAVFCVKVPPMKNWPYVGIELTASITVDPEGNRAMLTGESEYSVLAKPGEDNCQEQAVAVMPTADLSRPITIKFDLEPLEIMTKDNPTFVDTAARLSEESNLHSEFDLQLTRDCGEDLICRPWLEMTLTALDSPYIPGTQSRLGALITVRNIEEPAYGIRVHLTLPAQPKRVPQSCKLQGLNMTCNLPTPLFRHHSVTWEVELEYTLNATDEEELYIDAVIEDPVFFRNVSDEPTQELNMLIIPEATFNISGKALPNATVAVSREKLAEGSLIPFAHYFEVALSTPIEGCVTDSNVTILECTWSVPANVSLPIVLLMKYDLKTHGKTLEADVTQNLTTILFLYEQNKTTYITTTLVLNPAPPIWPLVVGAITGFVLLAVIAYGLYKYGFFSRKRLEDFKSQQDAVPLHDDPGSSASPPSTPPSPENRSTKELVCDTDSD